MQTRIRAKAPPTKAQTTCRLEVGRVHHSSNSPDGNLAPGGKMSMLQAGATGFEPAISGLTGRHVNRYTTPPYSRGSIA